MNYTLFMSYLDQCWSQTDVEQSLNRNHGKYLQILRLEWTIIFISWPTQHSQRALCSAFPGRLSQLDARVLCVKIQLRATQEQTKACEFSLIGTWEGGWTWYISQTKLHYSGYKKRCYKNKKRCKNTSAIRLLEYNQKTWLHQFCIVAIQSHIV